MLQQGRSYVAAPMQNMAGAFDLGLLMLLYIIHAWIRGDATTVTGVTPLP